MKRDEVVISPGVRFEVLKGAGGEFLGLGRIKIAGVVIRTGREPMQIELIGRAGRMEHEPFILDSVELAPGGSSATLHVRCGFGEGQFDEIEWRLTGEEWWVEGMLASGFSYCFGFQSESRLIHKVVESSSWCLDGEVDGLLFLEQSEGFDRGSRAIHLNRDAVIRHQSPRPEKYVPEARQGDGDWLDTLLGRDKMLVRFVSEPALSYRDLWREPNEPEIHAREEYVTPLTREFVTPPMTVLVCRKEVREEASIDDRSALIPAWYAVRDATARRLREKAKVIWQPSLPWVGIPSFDVGNWPEDVDRRLDFYAQMGFKRLWKWSLWQTHWSEADSLGEEDKKRWKEMGSASVLRLKWASCVEQEKIAELCRKAEERGMEVIIWFPCSALSPVSPLVKEHPEWITRKKDGSVYYHIWEDLIAVFHPAGYGNYALSQLRKLREEVGFHGVWLDCFQIFGNDVINYGTEKWENQFEEVLGFVRELQNDGLTVMVEGHTPFAIPAGIFFLQNLESAPEFLVYGCSPYLGGKKVAEEQYFRLLAFKAPPLLDEKDWWENERLQELGAYVNRAYNERAVKMCRCVMPAGSVGVEAGGRVVLAPESPGVIWWDRAETEATVFAFRDWEVSLGRPVESVEESQTGQSVSSIDGKFRAKAWHVYVARVRPEA